MEGCFGVIFVIFFNIMVTGTIVMLLWNWIMPYIFNLPKINIWMGWGITFLCSLLFKAFSSSKK